MCFGPIHSLTAFIFGSLMTIVAYSMLWEYEAARYFLIYFEFAIFVQLAEYFAWREYQKNGRIPDKNISFMFWIVILQPIVFLTCAMFSQLHIGKLSLLHILIAANIIYVYVLFYVFKIMNNKWDVEPTKDCPHIKLAFGNESVYFMATAAVLALSPPIEAISILLIGTISKIISNMVYGCSSGSVWCLLAAVYPILFAQSVITLSAADS